VLVPAIVYLLHYDQHLAQGTSLFILLPPTGLGALLQYWKNKQVDLRAGITARWAFSWEVMEEGVLPCPCLRGTCRGYSDFF